MQTLLLVDDEPNIVEGLASQFEQRYGDGVIVLKSCSGRHALSVLQNNRVDVVLSDIRMPDLDGLELIEETERLWPRTHFVLLSGFEDFDYIHRASKSTIYRGYLLKSEGDEVVMEKVDKELRLCAEELGWKRTTTYTVLKKLCAKGIFRNENSIVTALVKKEQVQRYESQSLLEKSFGGSLPRFITAFLGDRQLSQEEADELQALIDRHRQAEKGAEREGRDAQ